MQYNILIIALIQLNTIDCFPSTFSEVTSFEYCILFLILISYRATVVRVDCCSLFNFERWCNLVGFILDVDLY